MTEGGRERGGDVERESEGREGWERGGGDGGVVGAHAAVGALSSLPPQAASPNEPFFLPIFPTTTPPPALPSLASLLAQQQRMSALASSGPQPIPPFLRSMESVEVPSRDGIAAHAERLAAHVRLHPLPPSALAAIQRHLVWCEIACKSTMSMSGPLSSQQSTKRQKI